MERKGRGFPTIEDGEWEESKELKQEEVARFLGDIKDFSENGYDDYLLNIDGLVEKVESKQILVSDDRLNLDAIVDKILSVSVLNADNLHRLEEDLFVKDFLRHDIRNILDAIFFALDGCDKTKSDRIKVKSCAMVLKKWPIFSLILEDILLRTVPSDELSLFTREFNAAHFWKGLENFVNKPGMAEKMKYEKLIMPNDFPNLEKDEKIVGSPGLVLNSLLNLLRNACDNDVGSSSVKLEIKIEDGGEQKREMVFRVMDNGIGIPPSFLEKENENYIFQIGKSHRGSTGFGLADMPQRLNVFGGGLSIISTARKQDGESFDFASFTNKDEARVADLKEKYLDGKQIKDESGKRWSTIFEIRLPIVKNK